MAAHSIKYHTVAAPDFLPTRRSQFRLYDRLQQVTTDYC